MVMNPENTLQQLSRIHYQRTALQGVLRHRMSPALDKRLIPLGNRQDPGGIRHCTLQLLKYASEEHRLRQRIRRKAQLASGQETSACQPIWQLRACISDNERIAFTLPHSMTVTGRHEQCDLLLPLPYISREHAVLSPQADGLHVRDLHSTNGTSINGQTVREGLLRAGDTLTIAGMDFVLEYCGSTEGVFTA